MQETAIYIINISLGPHSSQENGGRGGTNLPFSAISTRSRKSVILYIVLHLK